MKVFNCPLCGEKFNKAGKTFFCQCGWHKSCNKKIQSRIQKEVAKGIVMAGIGLMAGIVYINHWGTSSFKAMPLKIAQWTDQLNESSFTSLKKMCLELKKYDCVEQAHHSFLRSSGNLEVLAELGNFQYRRRKFKAASMTYNQYFTKKGKDVKAAYNYARILEKEGKAKSALSYYEYALTMHSNTIQVTIIRSYINLLVKSGQHNKARQQLLKLKPLLKNASVLVQQEYDRWNQQINTLSNAG